MRHYCIASHGTLSKGFLSAVKIIMGDDERVSAITAYVNNQSIEELAKEFLGKIKEGDEVVIFTDLVGGSVNQYFITQLERSHFHLITGINLALIIEFMLMDEEGYLTEEVIMEVVERAREQLVYMNCYVEGMRGDNGGMEC